MGDRPNFVLCFIHAGTLIVTNATYWGVNSFFMILDVTNKPNFLTKYKMQEDKNVPVSTYILPSVYNKQWSS